jgi:hypothetical protein
MDIPIIRLVTWRNYRFALVKRLEYYYYALENERIIASQELGFDRLEAFEDFNSYVTEFICSKLQEEDDSLKEGR